MSYERVNKLLRMASTLTLPDLACGRVHRGNGRSKDGRSSLAACGRREHEKRVPCPGNVGEVATLAKNPSPELWFAYMHDI